MRVLLANPAYRIDLGKGWERYFFCAGSRCPWSLVKRIEEPPRYSMFPFFLAYSAALLREDGFDVHVLDGVPLNLPRSAFDQRVRALQPDVVLFEPATVSIRWVLSVAKAVKDVTGATIVFAGAHASVCREPILRENRQVDYILAGEYEFPCRELLRRLRDGRSPEGLAGVSGRDRSGRHFDGGTATPIPNLDLLPFPARELFPANDHNDPGLYHDGFCQSRPAVQMHSSRGCPFCCSFCVLPQVMYRPGLFRTFSAERVVDEMELVTHKFGAREIYFDDDTFVGDRQHVLDICLEIRRRDLTTPWSVMGDAIGVDEDVLRAMSDSGCVGMKFGLESARPEILRSVGKPLSLPTLEQTIRRAAALGMKTHVTVSFGHLDDTEETVRETFTFSRCLQADSVQYAIATPYPGTRFFRDAQRRGLLAQPDFSRFDPTHNAVLASSKISRSFLEAIQAGAHRRWLVAKLAQPRWLLRQLRLLGRVARGQGLHGLQLRTRRALRLLFAGRYH